MIDEPVKDLTLTNGRTLHDVTAKSYAASSVAVVHAEGREMLRYDLFPAEYRTQLEARKPASKSQAEIEAATEAAAKRTAEGKAAAEKKTREAQEKLLRNGVRIAESKFTGISAVVNFVNETDQPVMVLPSQVLAKTADGRVWSGTNAGFEVPGRAQWPTSIYFWDGAAAPSPIVEVYWKR